MTSELNSEISDINTNIGDYTTANFMRIPKTFYKSATITNGVISINVNTWVGLTNIENILTIHATGDTVAWDFTITNIDNTAMTIRLSRQESETGTREVTFMIGVIGCN